MTRQDSPSYHFSASAIQGGVLDQILEAPDNELVPMLKRHGRPSENALALLELMSPATIRAQIITFKNGVGGPGMFVTETTGKLSAETRVLLPETICRRT